MRRGFDLIRLLADGDYHSGEVIAQGLGISRAAVWKALRKIADQFDLSLQAAPGLGYCLAAPLELLDSEVILAAMSAVGQARIARLEVHEQLDSTNGRLMAEGQQHAPAGTVCLAESQTAGRGRRGRAWVSPFAVNLYLSILWRYPLGPAALGGVSLAAGVAVAAVLERFGMTDFGLKWPNDLLWRGRKLGGLLLEVAGESQGPSYLVVGLGLNLRMDAAQGRAIDQPWVDLHQALDGQVPGRNRLAAALIDGLLEMLGRFGLNGGQDGLTPFLADWERFDLLRGQRVQVHLGERLLEGDYCGIDADGALRLNAPGGPLRLHSGEVSVKATQQ
ncbi:MAG TPA: biotin--[acetyl-CoA-carboxylase] ligase [Lamprocystis sp. (in: g-proteobacteria)]|nr:biotin--[acetyl-CoA-carboxylase] ligase [Lamprocystis sp. (in: g-proteobacteria)]